MVVAVCRGANAATVRGLGASLVVDYTKAPFEEHLAAVDKFDIVVDFVGGSDTQRSGEAMQRQDRQFITALGWRHLGHRATAHLLGVGWQAACFTRVYIHIQIYRNAYAAYLYTHTLCDIVQYHILIDD